LHFSVYISLGVLVARSSFLRFCLKVLGYTILLEWIMLPFWLHRGLSWPALPQLAITALAVPALVAYLGAIFIRHAVGWQVFAAFAISLVAVLAAAFSHYALWSIGTRRFWSPDHGTVSLVEFVTVFDLAVVVIACAVAALRRPRRIETPNQAIQRTADRPHI
jgi:hypothetical protein